MRHISYFVLVGVWKVPLRMTVPVAGANAELVVCDRTPPPRTITQLVWPGGGTPIEIVIASPRWIASGDGEIEKEAPPLITPTPWITVLPTAISRQVPSTRLRLNIPTVSELAPCEESNSAFPEGTTPSIAGPLNCATSTRSVDPIA